MKSNPRQGRSGFTLIELMAVITIIVILAGLVVGGMSFVSERQAKEKAKVQMARIATALEEYKLDFGAYPPTTDRTGQFTLAQGTNTSSILFDYLYFDSDRDGKGPQEDTDQKIYIPEMNTGSKSGWTTGTESNKTTVTDPWGNQYCYRTAVGAPQADGTVSANKGTMNPDFDLWSMGKDGQSKPETASDKANRDDIKH